MLRNIEVKYKTWTLFLITSICIIGLQSKLIINDPVIEYDDHSILKPLENNLFPWTMDYYLEIFKGQVVDFQPIRDLSLSFDVLIKKTSGLGIYHLHNCFIWILTGILFYNILLLINISPITSSFLYLLFSFNPVLWNAVSWISARKHLLSAFFIILATFEILKYLKGKIPNFPLVKISLLYFLSCFSQPINVAWPVFVILLIYYENNLPNKNEVIKLILPPLVTIGLATLITNYYYYSQIYPNFSDYPKFLNETKNPVSFQILSLGRSYFQTFLSFWPTPTPYYTGSFKNFLGIMVFVLFFFSIYKSKNKNLWAWAALSLLPLLIVTIKMTNIFGFDTYLITTIFSCYICLGIFINGLKGKVLKIAYAILVFTILTFTFLSHKIANAFENNHSVFLFGYEQEATPFNLQVLVKDYLEEKKFDDAIGLATQLINWAPYQIDADEIFSKIIYFAIRLERTQKIKIFTDIIQQYPELVWAKYFLACLKLETDNFKESYEHIKSINPEYYGDFGTALPKIMAHFMEICRKTDADCSDFSKRIDHAKKFRFWDQDKFIEQSKLYNSL